MHMKDLVGFLVYVSFILVTFI